MSRALVTPTTAQPGRVRRVLNSIGAFYLRFRLNEAEQELECFEREMHNRALQMEVHRKKCGEIRVQLSQLGAL